MTIFKASPIHAFITAPQLSSLLVWRLANARHHANQWEPANTDGFMSMDVVSALEILVLIMALLNHGESKTLNFFFRNHYYPIVL